MQFISFLIACLGVVYVWESARWVLFILIFIIFLIASHAYVKANKEKEDRIARKIEDKRRYEEYKEQVLQLIESHKKALQRKAGQLIFKNDYGRYVFDKWFSERDYFISSVIEVELRGITSFVDQSWLRDTVDNAAFDGDDADRNLFPNELPEGMSALDFEHYCAHILSESGWETRVTPPSGDQGIDIVAVFGTLKAVFQCKLYSSPIGNSAVQQIVAGREFESAQIAGVITNSTFTTSARQLAAKTNVHLLHFSELSDFLPELKIPSPSRLHQET